MLEKLRNRLLAFIESDKDVPLLAGFSVGFYMFLFYYSKNFALANSWQQLSFFIGYYILFPCISLLIGYKLLGFVKLTAYRKHFLFVGIVGFFSFFILQIGAIALPKRIVFAGILIVAFLLSVKFRKYYKVFIPLLFLMSVFNMLPVARVVYKTITASNEWKQLPDDIENIKFKARPNVYYIQPDGYTSFHNLNENPNYNIDNSHYEIFLKQNNFTLYDNYRSNYYSTLLSNSATFAMKHHYIAGNLEAYDARRVIMGDNPVLRIFRKNGYKSSFITEKPYLIINRPDLGYNYCNIKYGDLPYVKDGLGIQKDVLADLKIQMKNNGAQGNFYFLEKFTPGISVYIKISHRELKKKGRHTLLQSEKQIYGWKKR